MRTPLSFLKFVAKAVLNAAGGGVAGDFALEVLPDVARDVWQWWGNGRRQEELREEVQALAALPEAEARQLAEQAAAEEASGQPEAAKIVLTSYLAQVPAAVRRSQRRPADPSGRTVSSAFHMIGPEDLLPLLPARPPHFQPGDRPPGVGDWELVEMLGVGGFGEVWKARNPHLAEPVALKFCLDPDAARMLRNEAELLGRVMGQGRHPGIVRLLHTYLNAPTPCLEYEFVSGGDLTGLIRQWQKTPADGLPRQAERLMGDLAGAVGFAHRLNPPIVHRDLKPANVLLRPDGPGRVTPRVADFGIGGVAADAALRQPRETAPGQFLTTAIRGACTPLYSSPQQLRGDNPHPADDVYALGVIWYQLLTGDPTAGPGPDWQDELSGRRVPAESVRLLGACLASKPERRPANAADLAERLTALHSLREVTRVAPAEPAVLLAEEVVEVVPVVSVSRTPAPRTPAPRKPSRVRLQLEEGRLSTDLDRETVFGALLRVLDQFGVQDVLGDRESGTIQGLTKMNMLSLGQLVRARVWSAGPSTVAEVRITCRPPQLYDWGRGRRDSRAILERLARDLETCH
jgi:serine/threonine protein kinase